MSRSSVEIECREAMLKAIMARRDCDRDEAEIIMQRIADRLGGYTHEEAAQRHPLAERGEHA